MNITGPEARALRRRNGWSLQMLARVSGINKAYLSEFENGVRRLNDDAQQTLEAALQRGAPAGTARPQLFDEDGHPRLVFVDEQGNPVVKPAEAHIEWTEADGSTYRMFVGQR